MWNLRRLTLLMALCAASIVASGQGAGGGRFDPEKHFPSQSLVYVAVDGCEELCTLARGTLLGRMVTHPGWKAATRELLRLLDS
ncbi:MAG: hypothetical protein O7J95_19315, partial [Planctomycetota bacterium]|nr:hypothetical protein [Planctomycetota bacterium]